ncbi:hypothetical protein [Ramlibacter sp. AN1133]|uniref:hypothetical protein n=1 Tax=Ramlibacter sp. AN1133 TaxID=3133429 RepID=UPI0030C54BCA
MPHPRKHMKLTGDIHPPEVEDDLRAQEEAADAAAPDAAAAAQGTAGTQALASTEERYLWVSMPARQYVDAARAQVRDRPLATAAAAFFAGFAVAVLTRSR